jgi:hypothetical protein
VRKNRKTDQARKRDSHPVAVQYFDPRLTQRNDPENHQDHRRWFEDARAEFPESHQGRPAWCSAGVQVMNVADAGASRARLWTAIVFAE